MAPKYQLYSGFAVKDALAIAGAPRYKSEFQEGEPPVAFFTQPPKSSSAVFSTLFDTRPFRFVEDPTCEREGHYWWAAEIQRVCDELRRNLPDVCKGIETPRNYWDLYKYFDAYDIYYRGAQNLWNVINTLVFENEYAQRIVENEQKMQIERYMPLFEHLASELLRRPGIQTKLLTWDRERQQDVLKVLTAYELQIFEGYEKYPDHFLGAIRAILVRFYENLRKGSGSLAYCLAPIGGRTPNATASSASLRCYLQSIETSDDAFMDKFAIPNKIINGIVIADGTSKTAARKARHEAAILSHNLARSTVVQGNGAYSPSPRMCVPAEDVSSFSQESSGTTHRVSTTERCSSAPGIGSDPGHILSDPVAEEARVYPSDNYEVDKKLMGCPKPANLSPKDTGDDTSGAADAVQTAMPILNSRLQQVPTNLYQSLPNHYQGGHRQFSPIRQQTLPFAPNFVLGPVPSHQKPGLRDRGMSQGPFAHQIPPYAIHQQQIQYPHPAHIHPSGGGYTTHAGRPSSHIEPKKQHYAPPEATDSLEGSGQQNSNSSTQNYSNGKWQQIGSDDIHGPKAVFCMGSVHDRNLSNRRTSTASNDGNYHRLSNPRLQQHTIHTGPRQTDRDLAITGRSLRTSAASGHSLSNFRCVNAGRSISVFTKFDPCPCSKCSNRDRTIFVNRLRDGVNQTEGALQRLKQYFSKFGPVDSVTSVSHNVTCVHIMFASSQSAIAAVRTEPEVQIDDLGDAPLKVQFRFGSQFFTPHHPKNFAYHPDYRDRPTHNVGVMMPQPPTNPPTNRPNNIIVHVKPWYHSSLPEQQAVSPGGVPFEGQSPGADFDAASKCDRDLTNQTATQTESEMTTGRLSYSEMTSPVITPHPIHGLVVVDAKDTCGMASHQGKHSSRFGNTADLTHDMATFRQATNHDTPNNTVKSDHSPYQTAISHSNSQYSQARVPGDGDSVKFDEEASTDYGTVRIRPGKARYMAIPTAWRQESIPPQDEHETGSQYLEIASQCGLTPITKAVGQPMLPLTKSHRETAPPLHESSRNKISAEDELTSGHHDSCFHVKRKVSQTDGGEKAPDQPSPKKKFSRNIQPIDSHPAPQSSQPGHQQQQHKQQAGETGKTKTGKKKKNKNHQNQATQPVIPGDSSTAAPFAAHIFQPAIPASFLPLYPHQQVQRRETPHTHGAIYVRVPPTPPRFANRLDDSEPFPAYRDLMSGPQFPLKGHRSHASDSGLNRSMSSNASTIIPMYGFGPRNYRLNPGAQNFVPGPANTGHRDSISTLDPKVLAMHNSQEGSHAFRSPGRPVRATQDVRAQEAPQLHMQTTIERSDSSMSMLGQRAIRKPTHTQLSTGNKGETENSKRTHSKGETALKATSKDDNASKENTSAKQGGGGGKGKGKSKNAKAGRNDQKNAIQPPPVDRKGKSTTKPIGSKGETTKKVEAHANQYAEVLKQNLPTTDATDKHHAVVGPQSDQSSKQSGGEKGIKIDQQPGKGKGKEEVPKPEKKPAVAKEVETTTTAAEAKPKNDGNDDKVRTCPESQVDDPGTAKTSEIETPPTVITCAPGPSTASASVKPKQGKAKNRASKKGVGTQQQPPVARPSTITNTSTAAKSDPGESKNQDAKSVQQQAESQSGLPEDQPKTEVVDPASSSSSSPIVSLERRKKPKTPVLLLPALAPIPLCIPGKNSWQRTTVAATAAGNKAATAGVQARQQGVKDDVKDDDDDEKTPPPDGERKGG
ncbi:hypothetical protein F4782DRAFT_534089 [Xylaria castorea]|nr:hypothetical protein F4782DRAFT_534089 [Xylaria castorea]